MSTLEAVSNFEHCKSNVVMNCTVLPDFIDTIKRYSRQTNDANGGPVSFCKTRQILDAFLHLVAKHNNNGEEFQFIADKLGECGINTSCVMLRRNYRDRSKLLDTVYRGIDSINHSPIDSARSQILDKIHCFYSHQLTDLNQNINHLTNKTIQKYNQLGDGLAIHDKLYSFGTEFVYGYKGEGKHNYMSYTPIYKKYDNLKLEMTQNDMYRLTIDQFDAETQKANIHLLSHHCKKYFRDVSIEHILSLMIYSNYDRLQYEFSKTYRENSMAHNQFFHLAKYLKMSVQRFGTSIMDGIVKSFYHGIGEQLLFPETIGMGNRGVSIYCPLSTSSSFAIATYFCNDNDGLIVEFGGDQSKAKYFSMRWLSDFPSEYEMLFLQNYNPMQMNSIIDTKTGYRFDIILDVLKIIEQIIRGNQCDSNALIQHTTLIEQIIANQLFKEFPDRFQPIKTLHAYGAKLIDRYCKNKTELVVDYNMITEKEYLFLYELLSHKDSQWIKLELFDAIFPNVESIVVTNIDLSSTTFDHILYNIKSSKLKQIRILPNYSSSLIVKRGILQYKQAFRECQFDLSNDGDSLWLSIRKAKDTRISSRFKVFTTLFFTFLAAMISFSYSSAMEMADTCDANASCHNIFCLFGCHCDIGWIGDGKECQHICTIDPCDGNAICLQNASSSQGYQCYCNPGWTGNGVSQCMPKLDRNATKQWHFVKDVFVNVSDLDYDMVAAYDENADQDVITLLGGHNYPSNRYIFNISSHEIILVDSIPDLNIKSNGQNSVIINDLLYYSLEGKLHNIDLGTFKPSTIQKKMLETHNECITSDHENNIFMIGGTSYIARNGGSFTVYEYLQIYNIPGGQWFLGVNLTQPRFSGSCAYWKAQDTLYYFGGYVGVRHNMLRDVVVLRSVSSKNNSWKAAASTLTAKVSGTHAFVSSKHQIILIIGIVGRHEFPFCNEFHLLGEHITNCQPFNNMFYQKF
eukprot:20203_1